LTNFLYIVNQASFFISHRLDLAKEVLRQGHKVSFCGSCTENESNYLNAMGIKTYNLSLKPHSFELISDMRLILELFYYFRKIKPDVIHLVTLKPIVYGSLVAKFFKIKLVVIAITGLGFVYTSKIKKAQFLKVALNFSLRIMLRSKNIIGIFQNRYDIREFNNLNILPKSKCYLIKGSGVDSEKFIPNTINRKEVIVLLASRMIFAKGVIEYITAANNIIKNHANVKFWIAGPLETTNPDSIPAEILKNLDSQGRIKWLGNIKEMSELLAEIDIACLPTYYGEGVPKFLIEAAFSGKPIVTTRSPGCDSIVRNNINGFLVKKHDITDLEIHLLKLIKNKQLRKKMGANSRKLASIQFSLTSVIKQTTNLYEKFAPYKNVTPNSIAILSNQAYSLLNFRGTLIRSLLKDGLEVYLLAPDFTNDERRYFKKIGAIVISCKIKRVGFNPLIDLVNLLSIYTILKKINPDIFLAYFIKPVIYGSIAAKMANIKRIISLIEGLGYVFTEDKMSLGIKRKVLKFFTRKIFSFSLKFNHSLIFLNSDDVEYMKNNKILNANFNNYYKILGIGVNLKQFKPVKRNFNDITFILVARMIEQKGILDFVQAARIIKLQYPYVKFKLYGGLDLNPTAIKEEIIHKWLNEGLLTWEGHVSNINKALCKASVFVLPSYREGLSKSVQEAMAAGLPIITTNAPGCRESIVDGINGILVDINSPYELSTAMRFFIENPSQIKKMGEASRNLAIERYDEKIQTDQIKKVIYST
jgi:glycosyltransferase involved in cell wall biosynthesis